MRLTFLFLLLINLLHANTKIALLIGNQDYNKPSLELKNPINDIEAIEETLESIGFEVELLKDATKREMEDGLDEFYKRAEGVDIALVYFSGHGLQVFDVDTDRVVNYLLPIEANVHRLRDLKNLIRLDSVVSDSSSAKKSIILIDACRDNPLYDEIAHIFRKHGVKSASVNKGLGQIDFKTNDVLIAFATTSNHTANDGRGEISPYAKALSNNLQKSADISLVLRDVRVDVLKQTNHEQEPVIIKNTLSGKVCLSGDKIIEVVEADNRLFLGFVSSLVGIIIFFLIILKMKSIHKEKKILEKLENEKTLLQIKIVKNLEEHNSRLLEIEVNRLEEERKFKKKLVEIEIEKKEWHIRANKKLERKDAEEEKSIIKIGNILYQNQPFTKKYTWDEAYEYAKNLDFAGYDDWRLPSKRELENISNIRMYGDFTTKKNQELFFNRDKKKRLKGSKGVELFIRTELFLENMQTGWRFWTSEQYKDPSFPFSIDFKTGKASCLHELTKCSVLCVR